MPSLSLHALAMALLGRRAAGDCAFGPFVEAYSPERCWIKDGAVSMKCDDKWSSVSCGMRLNALGAKVGAGKWSMKIKAAPGSGAVTTFYLSNNAGMYDLSKPWNEVDFEIFGNTASDQGSKVWTNLFTGHMDEHNQVIHVPFNVSADFHTYTFELSDTSIRWLVDGVLYRAQDIRAFPDAQSSVRSYAFRPFISFWGKTSKDPALGVPEFREMMGKLDWSKSPFPLVASFKHAWNPPVPALPDRSGPCGPTDEDVDYVTEDAWYRRVDGVGEQGECCSLCQQEEQCKSWTVVLPYDGQQGQCWLKGGLPSSKKAKAHVISGLPRPSEDSPAEPEAKFALLEPEAAAGPPPQRVGGAAAGALLVAGAAALAALAGARRGRGMLLGMQLEGAAASEELVEGAFE